MIRNNFLVLLCFLLFAGIAFAQNETPTSCADLQNSLDAMQSQNELLQRQLDNLNTKIATFTNEYANTISTQTQMLQANENAKFQETQDLLVNRTRPLVITFPVMVGWLAIFAGMIFLFSVLKGRDALIKWYNRKNLLCTCQRYARFDKGANQWNCKCGKNYKIIQFEDTQQVSDEQKKIEETKKKGIFDLFRKRKEAERQEIAKTKQEKIWADLQEKLDELKKLKEE